MLKPKMVVATIPVTELERSKQFYGGTLGLALLHENPFSARYDAGGGSQLSIFKRPPTKTEHTLAHFEVDDIVGAVRDLKAKARSGCGGRGVQHIAGRCLRTSWTPKLAIAHRPIDRASRTIEA